MSTRKAAMPPVNLFFENCNSSKVTRKSSIYFLKIATHNSQLATCNLSFRNHKCSSISRTLKQYDAKNCCQSAKIYVFNVV